MQATRLPFAAYFYNDVGPTNKQDSGSWVYKAEWNGTLTDKLYVEARYGDFGYYFPLTANTDEQYCWRDTGLSELAGGEQRWQLDRDRKQTTAAATYFLDTAKGSHTFKVGGEILREIGWEGYEQRFGGDIDHQYANGVSSSVVFALPTATEVGKLGLGRDGALTSQSALNVFGAFINDTWSVGRLTVNGGLRYDRYSGYLPEQQQLAATVGPVSVPAATFAQQDLYTWNQIAPRIGATFDLSGDGKTVHQGQLRPVLAQPGRRRRQRRERQHHRQVGHLRVGRPSTATAAGSRVRKAPARRSRWPVRSASIPDIKAPKTNEVSVWLERQITETMGIRAGYVYKDESDLIGIGVPGRDARNGAYSVPFPFTDIGADNVRGTADDQVITLYGMPTARRRTSRWTSSSRTCPASRVTTRWR